MPVVRAFRVSVTAIALVAGAIASGYAGLASASGIVRGESALFAADHHAASNGASARLATGAAHRVPRSGAPTLGFGSSAGLAPLGLTPSVGPAPSVGLGPSAGRGSLASLAPSKGAGASAGSVKRAMRALVTIQTRSGPRVFRVDVARTAAEQTRGLMYRTNIAADGGMIFAPYPAEGPPRRASFWMKNTPSSLDIIFIRANGVIASIAANAEPFSEVPIGSGEPVGAVLEINAGKAAELGIAVGDKVKWADLSQ